MKYLLILLAAIAINTSANEVAVVPEVAELQLPETSRRAPLSQKSIVVPAAASAGDTVTLFIKGQLMDDWHIYAYDPTQVFKVTEHSLVLPDGIAEIGEWKLPDAEPYMADPNILIYHGELLFARQLKLANQLTPGDYEIEVQFSYQTCDPYMCLPPKREKQVLTLTIK